VTGNLKDEFDEASKKLVKETKKKAIRGLRDATPVDTGEARDGWTYDDKGIYNPVEHLRQLNRGSSMQAPLNFVESAILSTPGVEANGIIVRED